MKQTALAFLFIIPFNLFGQSFNLVDSLSNEICKSIAISKEENDSIRVFKAFKEHAIASLTNFTKDEKDSIGDNIYFRLQRLCPVFNELLVKNSPKNKYWQTVFERPQSHLKNSDCLEFQEYKNYKYIEMNGDTVKLKIDSGFWVDNFKDGTYSKLKVYWSLDCYFDIEFIESNNNIRKKFSKPGDKFRYTILEKFDNYYLMSVEIVGIKRFSIFKIFY